MIDFETMVKKISAIFVWFIYIDIYNDTTVIDFETMVFLEGSEYFLHFHLLHLMISGDELLLLFDDDDKM